jgi:hypothetical protein
MKKRFKSNLSIKTKLNQKRNVLIGISLSLVLTLGVYVYLQMGNNKEAKAAPKTVQKSNAEKTGDWNTASAWSTGILSSVDSIVVDGTITSIGDVIITANQSLRVAYQDTLIIKQGSLSIPNTSSLTVYNGAVVVVEKDYINNNKTSDVVKSGGVMIVLGKLELNSNNSDIEIQNGGAFYYDTKLNDKVADRLTGTGTKLDLKDLPGSLYALYVGTLLPVKITDFTLNAEDKGIEIEWVAREEYNVLEYQIQRSREGTHFETVGAVPAQEKAIFVKDYNFVDASPKTGDNYYRLAVLNMDGTIEYSDIETVRYVNNSSEFLVFPSVISGTDINFKGGDFQNKNVKVVVYDLNGRAVLTNDIKAGDADVQTINFPQKLKSGNYYIQIAYGNTIEKEKFIVTE